LGFCREAPLPHCWTWPSSPFPASCMHGVSIRVAPSLQGHGPKARPRLKLHSWTLCLPRTLIIRPCLSPSSIAPVSKLFAQSPEFLQYRNYLGLQPPTSFPQFVPPSRHHSA
jgi:hypothetical protein